MELLGAIYIILSSLFFVGFVIVYLQEEKEQTMQFNIPTEYKEYHKLNEQELDDYTRELINRRLETLTAYLKCKEYIK